MRSSFIAAVVAALVTGLAVVGISIASESGSSGTSGGGSTAQTQPAAQTQNTHGKRNGGQRRGGHRGGAHGLGFGPLKIAFKGFADKLGVSTKDLRAAVQGVKKRALDRAVSDGTISQAERDALDACMKRRRSSSCDRRQAKAAHRKLHRALKQRAKTDASGLKAQLFDDLGAELGKDPADVEKAARDELSELLDMAVSMGFVTERGRELALGCFDKPDDCDRAALRAEIKKKFRRHGGKGHHGGRRGHGHP